MFSHIITSTTHVFFHLHLFHFFHPYKAHGLRSTVGFVKKSGFEKSLEWDCVDLTEAERHRLNEPEAFGIRGASNSNLSMGLARVSKPARNLIFAPSRMQSSRRQWIESRGAR